VFYHTLRLLQTPDATRHSPRMLDSTNKMIEAPRCPSRVREMPSLGQSISTRVHVWFAPRRVLFQRVLLCRATCGGPPYGVYSISAVCNQHTGYSYPNVRQTAYE
jgi:hypothetical protein